MNFNIIEYFATFLSIIGSIYVARMDIKGYYLWFLANIMWVVFGLMNTLYGVLTTFVCFEITTIYGLINWKKSDNNG